MYAEDAKPTIIKKPINKNNPHYTNLGAFNLSNV